jgi:hypothetical protein
MKKIYIVYCIAILALTAFYSCTKQVNADDSGLLISSTSYNQKSNSVFANDKEYSMMKLMLNYGTVTPYKKILGNWYASEQNTSIVYNEGC